MLRRFVIVAIVLAASVAAPSAQQKASEPTPLGPIAPLDVARLLDLYAAGRFDEAVGAVAQAGDEVGRNLRRHWMADAPPWIDADPADRSRRLLVVSALVLETENVRAERGDWGVDGSPPCAGPCVLNWAEAQLVARGAPDQAEHAWYLTAAALAGGVRDWNYLFRFIRPQTGPGARPGGTADASKGAAATDPWPADPAPPPPLGLMDRALTRFPGDPRLLLEQALAAAGRFSVTTDGERYTPTVVRGPAPTIVIRGFVSAPPEPPEVQPIAQREAAVALFGALVNDPIVGVEACLRLGYLRWVFGEDDAARADLEWSAAETTDPDLRYLARFLLGWTALVEGDTITAIPQLRAALQARPNSQSAAVALASLELQRGDATAAYDIAQASLDNRSTDNDPWRLFLYAHHPRLPALIADLRKRIRP
jgi:hypothetical protein